MPEEDATEERVRKVQAKLDEMIHITTELRREKVSIEIIGEYVKDTVSEFDFTSLQYLLAFAVLDLSFTKDPNA